MRAAGLAAMVGGLFAGRNPLDVIPARYRPKEPAPRVMTEEERQIALQMGVNLMGQMLKRD